MRVHCALGARLLLIHAEGDDRVAVAHSWRLHAAAPGSRLLTVAGGDHHSAQHDPALQAEAVRFLAGLAAAAGAGPAGAASQAAPAS